MNGELERDEAISGRVFTNGVAQEVTRDADGNLAGVRLTFLPGYRPASGLIPLPEPLTAKSGTIFVVTLEGLADGTEVPSASFPMRHPVRHDTTVTTVYMPIPQHGALPPAT